MSSRVGSRHSTTTSGDTRAVRIHDIDVDVAALAGGAVLAAAALDGMRRILGALRKLSLQAEAFLGSPASGSIAARPGILERATDHEERLDRLEQAVAGIAGLQTQMVSLQDQMTQLLAAEAAGRSAT